MEERAPLMIAIRTATAAIAQRVAFEVFSGGKMASGKGPFA